MILPANGCAGRGVSDGAGERGKVPCPLGSTRNDDRHWTRSRTAFGVLRGEEREGFILHDGTTDGSAKLVELEGRPARC